MPIDWASSELVFLRDQLAIGQAVLFAGAGFSIDALNRFGKPLPLGGELARLLAERASFPFANESLSSVYEAVGPRIGTNNLWTYLEELYTVECAANWYRLAMGMTWHRVYTTNIDTLFQHLAPFASRQRLKTIVRGDAPQERDQYFETLQCVHLHGCVTHRSNGLTFTIPGFATHTATLDPWYQALADDQMNHPIVFIGTTLDEPILSHYLEMRAPRDTSQREHRPRSYLVSPTIGPIKRASLGDRNIASIECTAQEFFESLHALPNLQRLDMPSVQKRRYPHRFNVDPALTRDVMNHFDLIVPSNLPTSPLGMSRFFLGAEPNWNDMEARRDGDRQVNQELLELLAKPADSFRCVAVLGAAGSGKTTTVMRVVLDLAASGQRVFFAHNVNRLDLTGLLDVLEKEAEASSSTSPPTAFVVVDSVGRNLGSIAASHERLKAANRLTLIVVERTNRYHSKCQRISDLDPQIVTMPDLSEADITSILQRLDQFNFLGVLKGKAQQERVRLFMERASRQLLVAMREATSGKDFALILQGEYEELETAAKLAYAICCIAVACGAPGVYTKHLSPCLPVSGFTKGFIISELLRGVLIPTNAAETMVKPRHRLIAHWVAHEIAPVEIRLQAISVFLKQVSPYIVPNEIRQRSPAYVAYRGMVNSAALRDLIGDQQAILDVYDELQAYYKNDFLFWLQYGMAQIDAENLDVAENFLNQSLALYPNSHQTLNHLGILYLIQATKAPNSAAVQARALEGMATLMDLIRSRGDFDTYPYHSYLVHATRWYLRAGDLILQDEWEALRAVGREACAKHRLDDELRAAAKDVETAYLKRLVRSPSPDADGD